MDAREGCRIMTVEFTVELEGFRPLSRKRTLKHSYSSKSVLQYFSVVCIFTVLSFKMLDDVESVS